MKVKEIKKVANVAWSPKEVSPAYIAAGTAAQQLDASFNTSAALDIYHVDLNSQSLEMPIVGSMPIEHRFHKLLWTDFGAAEEDHPNGMILGGTDDGKICIIDAATILSGDHELSLLDTLDDHVGPVQALDINKFQHNLIASGASDSEIFIWDLRNPETPLTPGTKTTPPDQISCLAWNAQVQHILASSTQTGRVVIWDLRKSEPIIKVGDQSAMFHYKSIAWNPNVATQVLIGNEDDRYPVIQLWDLRYAQSPMKIFEGHTRGVLALDWCPQDSDLLMSCGKDNKIFCWNPNTEQQKGEIVYEVPTSAQWTSDVKWCPRYPGLVSTTAFDGHITVSTLMGGSMTLHQEQRNQISDSFGIQQDMVMPNQPKTVVIEPLKKPPKWMRKPCGAKFGFGGKLISVDESTSSKQQVFISQVVTEKEFLSRSDELERAIINGQLVEFCDSKIVTETDPTEKLLWQFLKSNFHDEPRMQFLNLLGYNPQEITEKITTLLTQKPAATQAAPVGVDAAELASKIEQLKVEEEKLDSIPCEDQTPDPESVEEPIPIEAEVEGEVSHDFLAVSPALVVPDSTPAEIVSETVSGDLEVLQLESDDPFAAVDTTSPELLQVESDDPFATVGTSGPGSLDAFATVGTSGPGSLDPFAQVGTSGPGSLDPFANVGTSGPGSLNDPFANVGTSGPGSLQAEADDPFANIGTGPPPALFQVDDSDPFASSGTELFDAIADGTLQQAEEVVPAVEPVAEEPAVEEPIPAVVEAEPEVAPIVKFSIPTDDEMDGLICQALLAGNFEVAVDVCFNNNRLADGLLLAIAGGTDLFVRTQKRYLDQSQTAVSKIISAIVNRDWATVVESTAIANWKEALSTLVTYSRAEEFSELCCSLGERLEVEAQDFNSAILCYICAGDVEKMTACWAKSSDGENPSPIMLQNLIEKMMVLKKSVESDQQPIVSAHSHVAQQLSNYASLLSSQGNLQTALVYLSVIDGDGVAVLKDRVFKAHGGEGQTESPFEKIAVPAAARSEPATPSPIIEKTPSIGYQPMQPAPTPAAQPVPSYQPPEQQYYTPDYNAATSQPNLYAPPSQNTFQPPPPQPQPPQPQPNMYQPPPPQPQVQQPPPAGPPMGPPSGPPSHGAPPPQNIYNPAPSYYNPVQEQTPQPPQPAQMFNPMAQAPVTSAPPPGPPMGMPAPPPSGGGNIMSMKAAKNEAMAKTVQPAPMNFYNPAAVQSNVQPDMNGSSGGAGGGGGGGMPPMHHMTPQLPPQTQVPPQKTVKKPEPPPPKAEVIKGPIPEEHIALQQIFDSLVEKCREATKNPQAKRKLDDVRRKLDALYDLLRENGVSPNVLNSLHQMSQACQNKDYTLGMQLHTQLISRGNFSEISSFMPGLKTLMQISHQVKV